ncbi:MAG TPA: diguanylate cyclase [Anaerolineales bacterium]|nr:diguanylate cyclase [Anaerolineales bacterium]HRQ92161.1 diguanylate cyclase [Anaerolineales bacterium]
MQAKRRLRDLLHLSQSGDISDEMRPRYFWLVYVMAAVMIPLGWAFSGRVLEAPAFVRLLQLFSIFFLVLIGLVGRQGKIFFATNLMLWAFWALATIVVLIESDTNAIWLVPQFLLIVLTRLLLSMRIAFAMALLTLLLDLGIFALSLYKYLPSYFMQMTQDTEWAPLLISFISTVFIFLLGNMVLRDSLAQARRNEGRYRSLFDRTNDAVFLIDPALRYLDVNKQAAELLGYEPHELLGKPISEVIAPTEVTAMKANFARLQREGMIPLFERTMIRKDGSRIITEVGISLVSDEDGQPLYHQSVVRDITERKRLEDQLRFSLEEMQTLAMQDSLTGLLNRRAVSENAEAEWFRSQRENRPMCVVIIDLDNLKIINDKFGHAMGDQVILELARAIKTQRRRYDWAGRWGGDEFLLVLPGATLSEAAEVAERVRNLYTQSLLVADVGEDASVSLGVACYSGRKGDTTDIATLLNQADEALYKAKQEGKSQVQMYRTEE